MLCLFQQNAQLKITFVQKLIKFFSTQAWSSEEQSWGNCLNTILDLKHIQKNNPKTAVIFRLERV